MWINICAIYFYLLYIDVNRLKFPDAWYLYNVLCINNFIYIYNYIPNIIIYIIKRNIIIKQIYSNIPKKRIRFLDPFNLRVKTRRKKGEERRSYVWEKRKKYRGWRRSNVATVGCNFESIAGNMKKRERKEKTSSMQLDGRCRCKCKLTCNRRE